MSNNELSRAGFYARVSGDQQVKEETIASQIEALRSKIQEDGLRLGVKRQLSVPLSDSYSSSFLTPNR